MAAQFLTTSKLGNIINMIGLGQQSGILRAIRGQGQTREIGQIKFLNGQPASALLGQMTGANALSVLSNWGECIYSFDEYPAGDAAGHDSSDNFTSPLPDMGPSSPTTGLSSGSWPSYGYGNTFPTSQPPSAPHSPDPYSSSLPNHNPSQSFPPGYTPGYPPSYPSTNTSSSLSGGFSRTPAQPAVKTNPTMGGGMPSSHMLNTVPQRTYLAEHIEQLPLDRRERMILLLVDGRRSIVDLSRLTRRNERELLAVLSHLSALGLVQMG